MVAMTTKPNTAAVQEGPINFEAFKWHQELQGDPERYCSLLASFVWAQAVFTSRSCLVFLSYLAGLDCESCHTKGFRRQRQPAL